LFLSLRSCHAHFSLAALLLLCSTVLETTFISRTDTEAPPRDFLLEKFPKWTLAHWCILITAASFLILALLPEARLNDFDVPTAGENVRVARALAFHGAFADPFATLRTGPTAHVAPVYPSLYSLVLRIFGTAYNALLILWAANVAFLSLQFGLLPLLSHRLHLGVLPGIAAAALGSFSLYAPIDTRWESFLAGLLLVLAFFLSEEACREQNWAMAFASGMLWGVLLLTNPVAILLLVAWPFCWISFQSKPERTRCAKRFVAVAAVALVTVSPWLARNYSRFGTFIFIRDNLGLELYTSNNPCAAPSIRENIQSGCHARTHPNPNAVVAAEVAASGEPAFNRAKLHEALTWIVTHRAAFLALTFHRIRLFWFPEVDRTWEAVAVWLVTLLSFLGIGLMAATNRAAAALLLTAWLLFPLVYYITQFEARYRYPIYWTTLLPAGYALAEFLRRLFRSRPKPAQ